MVSLSLFSLLRPKLTLTVVQGKWLGIWDKHWIWRCLCHSRGDPEGGVKGDPCQLGWPWPGEFPFLGLSFFICKMGPGHHMSGTANREAVKANLVPFPSRGELSL